MVTCPNTPAEAALGGVAPTPAHKADRRRTALRASSNTTAGRGTPPPCSGAARTRLERRGPDSDTACRATCSKTQHSKIASYY